MVMVMLYLLVTTFGFATPSSAYKKKDTSVKAQSAALTPKFNIAKVTSEPLKVTEAASNAGSRSGLVNEFDSLFAVPLLFLLLALFFPDPQPKTLSQLPVWRRSFFDFFRILTSGP